jgi:putative DNA primase/helicase
MQGLVDVRRADKLEGPTGIYTLVLADSGERKTSSDGHFSKPIAQWEMEKAEEAKPHIKKYKADVAVWEANRSGLTSAISIINKYIN